MSADAAGPIATVYLVGAGPGDPDLLTIRGLDLLRRADTVVHDRLIPRALLRRVRPGAEIIDAGKSPGRRGRTQEEINRLLVERARAGRCVVRLKGGDPFVFGRGGEEMAACHAAGVACVVVPGVTSAVAAPAAAGIPVTQRGVSRSFTVLTAQNLEQTGPAALPDAALVGADTLVVLMGRAALREVMARIMAAGRPPETPVACVQEGTTSSQRCATGTLATMAAIVEAEGLSSPMIIVVGEVARLCREPAAPGLEAPGLEAPGVGVPGDGDHGRSHDMESPALPDPPAVLTALRRGPLAGLRIVNTRPVESSRELVQELVHRGARVVDWPLIDIAPPLDYAELDHAIHDLARFDWIMFTSQHAVAGFWNRLQQGGRDARALGPCRVAAVGPRTAAALAQHGVIADLVPKVHTAAGLLACLAGLGASDAPGEQAEIAAGPRCPSVAPSQALLQTPSSPTSPRSTTSPMLMTSPPPSPSSLSASQTSLPSPPAQGGSTDAHPGKATTESACPRCVLLPRSDRARRELPDSLRRMGVQVTEAICYRTLSPPSTDRFNLCAEADAVLLYSPSAVQAYIQLAHGPPRPVLACIGPTTASAARAAGIEPAIIADEASDAGMIRALEAHFGAGLE